MSSKKSKSERETAILIKKYGNRRLYDTTQSRYMNLEEIAEMIKAGKEIRVVDAKTDEDLTAVILIQILLEDSFAHKKLLPVPFLMQLIRASDWMLPGYFQQYITLCLEAFLKMQEEFSNRMGMFWSAEGRNSDLPNFWNFFTPPFSSFPNLAPFPKPWASQPSDPKAAKENPLEQEEGQKSQSSEKSKANATKKKKRERASSTKEENLSDLRTQMQEMEKRLRR